MHKNVQLSSAPYGYYFINQVFLRQNAEGFFFLSPQTGDESWHIICDINLM